MSLPVVVGPLNRMTPTCDSPPSKALTNILPITLVASHPAEPRLALPSRRIMTSNFALQRRVGLSGAGLHACWLHFLKRFRSLDRLLGHLPCPRGLRKILRTEF